MRVLSGPVDAWNPVDSPSALTIGVFDGVHRGHQALLERLSGSHSKAVLTFDPHPLEVLRPGTDPKLITTIDERIERLGEFGVSRVGVLDLSEVRDYTPQRFVEEVLVGKLKVAELSVGADFRFGKDRAGDVGFLQERGLELGYEVVAIDLVEDTAAVVSSKRIRSLIVGGEVGPAAALLGDRYRMRGPVVSGKDRGRELGFPTANLEPPKRKVIPATGIYAGFVKVGGQVHRAAVNVGVRPTFRGGGLVVEAYILDFEGDIYGSEMIVEFVEYLRPEKKFPDASALSRAMTDDVAEVREVLEGVSTNMS